VRQYLQLTRTAIALHAVRLCLALIGAQNN
jgi:hypothetical protein